MSYEKALEVLVKISMKSKELVDGFGFQRFDRVVYITWCRAFCRDPFSGCGLYARLYGNMTDEEMIQHGVKWGLDEEKLRFLAKRLREESCVFERNKGGIRIGRRCG